MEKNWILSAVMFKRKKVRMVRTLASISKSENSAKSSIVIALSTETASAKENRKNLDKILKEISKLNSRFPNEVKLHKQVIELPKSDIPWIPSFLQQTELAWLKERLCTLTWRFHNELSSEVFDDGTK